MGQGQGQAMGPGPGPWQYVKQTCCLVTFYGLGQAQASWTKPPQRTHCRRPGCRGDARWAWKHYLPKFQRTGGERISVSVRWFRPSVQLWCQQQARWLEIWCTTKYPRGPFSLGRAQRTRPIGPAPTFPTHCAGQPQLLGSHFLGNWAWIVPGWHAVASDSESAWGSE